jgi:ATP-dependent DNA ligase
VGQGVNTVAGRLVDARINLAFSVRLTERYRATGAKTTKNQTIRKHTESAFIEPTMQCKSIAALPSGEKWTFEIKFDGYRCIAVKRAP